VKRLQLKSFHMVLVTVSIAVGIIFALQFRTIQDIRESEAFRRTQILSGQVSQMKKERDVLQAEVATMHDRLDKLSTGPLSEPLKKEMLQAKILAGVTGLAGSGVKVTLKDSNISLAPGENPNLYVVHDEDILRVVNELKASGAEGIAVNDQRLISSTGVKCNGPTIRINGKVLASPYVISAIGDPDTLESAIKMKGGVADTLQFFGIQVLVKKLDQIKLPAYPGVFSYEYAVQTG
jgi:uncharacterized protein YlxW (UPF0749 family)